MSAAIQIPATGAPIVDARSLHLISPQRVTAMKKPGINPFAALAAALLEPDESALQIVSTINSLRIDFDETKSLRNARDRGLPFSMVRQFDFGTAHYEADTRNPYPETRYVALACMGERLHVLCFTHITGGIRVISFRKANRRERMFHEKARSTDPS